jgi:cAMP-dependent protein kinase regulator
MTDTSLKAEAEQALSEGEIERALDIYQRLEISFQHEPSWSRQVAQLHNRLGDDKRCVEALTRAANRCAARREPIKVIAACKLILALDPDNERAHDLIGDIVGPEPLSAAHTLVPARMTDPILPLPRSRSQKGALELLGEGREPHPIPLFSLLSHSSLELLLKHSRLYRAPAGLTVFRQGDRGDALFVVVEGGVSVFLEGEPRLHLADLEEGSFFGEIAVFTDRPRGATVECRVDTELLEISRAVLLDALHEQPSAHRVLLTFLRDRLVDTVVKTAPLFRQLDNDHDRAALASRFVLLDAGEGAVLIEQAEYARGLYVLVDGSIDVVRHNGHQEVRLAALSPGHLFGEISTIARLPAVARAIAAEQSLLLFLEADKIDAAVEQHPSLLEYAAELGAARISEIEALETDTQPRIHLF